MPKIHFTTGADVREVDVPAGTTLMRAAVTNGVGGIVGECGGALTCATCHVLVSDDYIELLPAASDVEDDMLNYTAVPRTPNSRLSCQVVMTDALDGICLQVADPQI